MNFMNFMVQDIHWVLIKTQARKLNFGMDVLREMRFQALNMNNVSIEFKSPHGKYRSRVDITL